MSNSSQNTGCPQQTCGYPSGLNRKLIIRRHQFPLRERIRFGLSKVQNEVRYCWHRLCRRWRNFNDWCNRFEKRHPVISGIVGLILIGGFLASIVLLAVAFSPEYGPPPV